VILLEQFFCLLVHLSAIAWGADLSFTADVLFFQREISNMRGLTGTKFCTVVSTRPNFIMPVQNFWEFTPKKFYGAKTGKIWPDFGRLRSSAANVSGTDEDIRNWAIWSTVILPALGETSPVKFGPVTLEISMWNCTHLKCLFRRPYFGPYGVHHPQIFTRAREWLSPTSTPPPGSGTPLQFFSIRGQELA